MKLQGMLLLGGLVLAGCSARAPAPAIDAKPPFNASLDIPEFMNHVMEPTADKFWSGSGILVNKAGIKDLAPTTDEGWKTLEDGAAGLAEAGNALMIPGRARKPTADWYRHAAQLTKTALEAKGAAEHKDKARLIEVGGKLDEACTSCHRQFWPGSEG